MKNWLHEKSKPEFQFAYLFGMFVGAVLQATNPLPLWIVGLVLTGAMVTFVLVHKMTR